ncbi:FHA domain-containing protein [Hyalangium versicolor]|uniref:FHA domain-containing protein n=1 Tax=Hyalangium versicolor TaxID=2861190 RepID=UPI001CCFAD3F|nr:FHA domain-containing protein [Hyalangium versicolor]
MELPFDDDEVAPLQEDDPRPQRVPQFPAGTRRSVRGTRGPREGTKDRELATRFDTNEYSDPGHTLVFLYVEKGPGAGQLIPVKQGPLVIGRASACDLRLQHPSISRRHAQLMRQSERFILRDLGSQNGTFVNRVKVNSDHEIKVGDELALGNAVLKLRGSGVSSDKIPLVSAPGQAPVRKGSSVTRVALIAGAVGSAVAALLILALLKFSGSASPAPASAKPGSESAPPATDAQSRKAEEAYVPPPPATAEEKTTSEEAGSERAAKPIEPSSETQAGSGTKGSGPRASSLGSKSSASRRESSRSSAKGSTRQATAANANSDEILARYEKGDVAGALSLARAGQIEPLATKIAQFQSAQAAGEQAAKAQDTGTAIRNFTEALTVDQGLSQGWSVQGRTLRQRLGKLYTQAGQKQLKAGARDAARDAFEAALEYDPSNAGAKAELQRLNGKK